ncbi:unnamed protein product, partial [Rotaria sp. Silwood1]
THSSPSDVQHESTLSTSGDHSSTLKSPSTNPMPTDRNTSPRSASPTTSISLNSSHPLKKRLISEYELEQQRNSPGVPSTVTTSTEKVETTDEITNNANIDIPKNDTENVSNAEVTNETTTKSVEETENST